MLSWQRGSHVWCFRGVAGRVASTVVVDGTASMWLCRSGQLSAQDSQRRAWQEIGNESCLLQAWAQKPAERRCFPLSKVASGSAQIQVMGAEMPPAMEGAGEM